MKIDINFWSICFAAVIGFLSGYYRKCKHTFEFAYEWKETDHSTGRCVNGGKVFICKKCGRTIKSSPKSIS